MLVLLVHKMIHNHNDIEFISKEKGDRMEQKIFQNLWFSISIKL